MELRFYQREAIEACYRWMQLSNGNPVICIPTGGGKTPVIATLCNDAVTKWNGRVIVLAHVKELLEQTSKSITRMFPDLWTGIYSAGLGKRDTRAHVVVAGIQSVAGKVQEIGCRDLIIIDECHLIPPSGYGRYRQFIGDMLAVSPHTRVIGLTATPYRTGTGYLCGPDEILNEICYEVSVKKLIECGYLSKLTNKCGQVIDTSKLHIRAGEFVESEAESLMMGIVWGACQKIVSMTGDRKSVLVFGCGIKHAESIVNCLKQMQSERIELITGESLDFDRAKHIEDFKTGRLKYLVNVNVLTTGFDAPNVDCVCLLRPTVSAGLYYQMVGRGFRICEGKTNCLVLDFGDNVRRHGPVDQITPRGRKSEGEFEAPQKVCPGCSEYVAASATECPECGFVFDFDRGPKHNETPDEETSVVSGPAVITPYVVRDTGLSVHRKKGWTPDMPQTVRVRYKVSLGEYIDEWICPEHDGWARLKFEQWWSARSPDLPPNTARECVDKWMGGALAQTLVIHVETKPGEKFPRIKRYEIGPKPEVCDPVDDLDEGFEFPVPAESITQPDDWGDVPF